MHRHSLIFILAFALVTPAGYAHDGADGIPGTPDTTCEMGSGRADHDYLSATGIVIHSLQESNLEDCDGDFDASNPFCWLEENAREDLDGDTNVCEAFDDDEHDEYTRGGAWLLVESGDGVTGGSLLCFGREGHHPYFGPVTVSDLVFGQTVPFTVEADLVDATGLGDPCGDFQSDVSTSCVGTCAVTYPAGLDGSYQVYVGFGNPGTQGHVCTTGGDCALDGLTSDQALALGNRAIGDATFAIEKGRDRLTLEEMPSPDDIDFDGELLELLQDLGDPDALKPGGSSCSANCLLGTCTVSCASPSCSCDLLGKPVCSCGPKASNGP